jgi:hypothetical protein
MVRLALLVVACAAWGQKYVGQWDGRNWRMLNESQKSTFILGWMMAETALDDFTSFGVRAGEATSAFAEGFAYICSKDGRTVGDVVELLDDYYDSMENATTLLWRAVFLVTGKTAWWDE